MIWALDVSILSQLPGLSRGFVAGAVYALPIAFAGIIFSTLLKRSKDPPASLGSNLLGAVAGGIMEYSSMLLGLRALVILALGLYLGSLLVLRGWERTVKN